MSTKREEQRVMGLPRCTWLQKPILVEVVLERFLYWHKINSYSIFCTPSSPLACICFCYHPVFDLIDWLRELSLSPEESVGAWQLQGRMCMDKHERHKKLCQKFYLYFIFLFLDPIAACSNSCWLTLPKRATLFNDTWKKGKQSQWHTFYQYQ